MLQSSASQVKEKIIGIVSKIPFNLRFYLIEKENIWYVCSKPSSPLINIGGGGNGMASPWRPDGHEWFFTL